MQARLESSELAYLLHTLRGERAAGVDNRRLFPSQPPIRDALLSEGFAKLQQHGWLVASDGAINTNDSLMLLAAVVADPAYTLTVTHRIGSEARQIVTYSANQGLIVEIYLAADDEYMLTLVATPAELTARVRQGCSAWLSREQTEGSLTLTAEAFEQALALARAGDGGALARAVVSSTPALAPEVVLAELDRVQPVVHLEGAALFDQTIRAWGELAILRAANGACWLAQQDQQAGTIELWPASAERFELLLQQLLATLQLEPAV